MAEDAQGRVRALAMRQHGNVTHEQLQREGFTRGWIDGRRDFRWLIPRHVGVYAVGYLRTDPMSVASAAALACGPEAVLSHQSAAALWGVARWPAAPEVTVTTARRRPGIRIHRSRTLARRDRTRHHGIPVTSPARTALEIAPRLSGRQLSKAVNDAENTGYLRRDDLLEILARLPHAPGAPALREVAGAGVLRSPLEFDFRGFAVEYDLPEALTNVEVAGYVVDVLFPEEKVIVELDSWAFHRDRASFEEQRERDAATLQAGYLTVRETRERLHVTPMREAERLHDILRRRRQDASVRRKRR